MIWRGSINLSMMVSKYIGETEKNLEKLFDEAASSNAILFFDEADSIFGKRGEVREARDRFANIGVSYLLQRMEQYDGVTILATNLRNNIDEAFSRRLQFAVDLPEPREAALRMLARPMQNSAEITLAQNQHPHVATLYDVTKTYIVSEWVAGPFASGAVFAFGRNAACPTGESAGDYLYEIYLTSAGDAPLRVGSGFLVIFSRSH